jgi:hypothetical protein
VRKFWSEISPQNHYTFIKSGIGYRHSSIGSFFLESLLIGKISKRGGIWGILPVELSRPFWIET